MTTGVIAVHVGAGSHSESLKPAYRKLMKKACEKAVYYLNKGQSAQTAVMHAIKVLENSELTNAGRGSSLSLDGTVECDASIMDGNSLHHTAVGAVTNIKNPIEIPYKMLQIQDAPLTGGLVPPSFLSGSGAYNWASKNGVELCDEDYLICDKAKEVHIKSKKFIQKLENHKKRKYAEVDKANVERLDTVGAVCMDLNGDVASAVSSGGLILKQPGRIGQAAVYGCGCWAESQCNDSIYDVCVSTSGCGEHLVKTNFARLCANAAAKSDELGTKLAETVRKDFLESKFLRGVSSPMGGALILKTEGSSVDLFWLHTTESMGIGYMSTDVKPKTFFSNLPEEKVGTTANLNFATLPVTKTRKDS